MNLFQKTLVAIAVVLAAVMSSCSSDAGAGEHPDSGSQEESGTELSLNESYDEVRNGVRLILT